MCARNVSERELARLAGELRVLVGGDGPLVHDGLAVGREHPEADAVRLAAALHGQAVGGVEQPEGRAHVVRGGGETEETAHGQLLPLDRNPPNLVVIKEFSATKGISAITSLGP